VNVAIDEPRRQVAAAQVDHLLTVTIVTDTGDTSFGNRDVALLDLGGERVDDGFSTPGRRDGRPWLARPGP